jgi:glucose-1-phosphate cytidylyltransferase
MKAVILAGGMGTRIRDVSQNIPKPMIEIGGKPIIWHIMKNLEVQGINEFIICLGFKGSVIKDYFLNYSFRNSDIELDLSKNESYICSDSLLEENWKVRLVDTGLNTFTGGRIKKVQKFLQGETFFCTYGDGLADIDLSLLLEEHRRAGKIATLTAVSPPSRFGVLNLDHTGEVKSFSEKAPVREWVNGGFFIFENEIFDFLDSNSTLEKEPMESLANSGQLQAYRHSDFWKPMDTYRDFTELNSLWEANEAPWKNW